MGEAGLQDRRAWDPGKLSRRAGENERLAGKIEKIHEESPDKGYPRLNDDLCHAYGIRVNNKSVLRICNTRRVQRSFGVLTPMEKHLAYLAA